MTTSNTTERNGLADRGTVSLVFQAQQQVLALADELETGSAPAALSAGLRGEMNEILLMVDDLRRIAKSSGGVGVTVKPEALSSTASTRSKATSRTRSTSTKGATRFCRTKNELIKIGKAGMAKEYRHIVPFSVLKEIAEIIDTNGPHVLSEFGFDDLMAWSDGRFKSYQVRIVIKWLKSIELIEAPSRGRYRAASPLQGRVVDEIESIEPENTSRVRRKKTSRKASGRGGGQ